MKAIRTEDGFIMDGDYPEVIMVTPDDLKVLGATEGDTITLTAPNGEPVEYRFDQYSFVRNAFICSRTQKVGLE